jgi:two-component system NarL family response regulator
LAQGLWDHGFLPLVSPTAEHLMASLAANPPRLVIVQVGEVTPEALALLIHCRRHYPTGHLLVLAGPTALAELRGQSLLNLSGLVPHDAPLAYLLHLAAALLSEAAPLRFPARATTTPALPMSGHISPTSVFAQLSGRQRDILCLIAQGKRAPDIAEALHISYQTVANHKARLAEALGLKGAKGLYAKALHLLGPSGQNLRLG